MLMTDLFCRARFHRVHNTHTSISTLYSHLYQQPGYRKSCSFLHSANASNGRPSMRDLHSVPTHASNFPYTGKQNISKHTFSSYSQTPAIDDTK